MTTTGISSVARRIRSSTRGTVMPCSRAAWVERWMVGPSARGSENGTPTSTKSAPAAATARRASSDSSGVGNPAVRYGMSAACRVPALPRMARQRAAIGCSDKVIADVDAVLDGVGDLHDRAGMTAFGILLREVGEEPVGHGDDLGIDGQLARPQRLGVAGEVGLHVVLVGDDHAPIGDLAVAAQPEQGQHAEPRVRLHDAPLFVAQPALLVQYLERHTRLAHVVE